MSKFASKVALPIILAGIFAVVIFIALEYEQLDTNSYIILSLLGVYVFSFGFATGQNFATPIQKLLKGAEDLSNGNLSSRVYLETKDELSELAKVFDKIAQEMEDSRDKEEKTEKSVDLRVRARTQALEETINALEQKVRNRTVELQNMIKNLEKFQGDSTIKELEISKLKDQIKSLEEDANKNNLKNLIKKSKAKAIEEKIENS